MNNRDREDFEAYLRNCTDAQVIGVWHKEHDAGRRDYAGLAITEGRRRGLAFFDNNRRDR